MATTTATRLSFIGQSLRRTVTDKGTGKAKERQDKRRSAERENDAHAAMVSGTPPSQRQQQPQLAQPPKRRVAEGSSSRILPPGRSSMGPDQGEAFRTTARSRRTTAPGTPNNHNHHRTSLTQSMIAAASPLARPVRRRNSIFTAQEERLIRSGSSPAELDTPPTQSTAISVFGRRATSTSTNNNGDSATTKSRFSRKSLRRGRSSSSSTTNMTINTDLSRESSASANMTPLPSPIVEMDDMYVAGARSTASAHKGSPPPVDHDANNRQRRGSAFAYSNSVVHDDFHFGLFHINQGPREDEESGEE